MKFKREYHEHVKSDRKRKWNHSDKGRLYRRTKYENQGCFIMSYKAQVGCKKCRTDDYRVLSFHHRNPEDKKFYIGSVNGNYSWGAILKELEKCDVACESCHRKDTKYGRHSQYYDSP